MPPDVLMPAEGECRIPPIVCGGLRRRATSRKRNSPPPERACRVVPSVLPLFRHGAQQEGAFPSHWRKSAPQSTQGHERIIGGSCTGRPAEGGLIFFGQGEARRSGHISNRQGTGT